MINEIGSAALTALISIQAKLTGKSKEEVFLSYCTPEQKEEFREQRRQLKDLENQFLAMMPLIEEVLPLMKEDDDE